MKPFRPFAMSTTEVFEAANRMATWWLDVNASGVNEDAEAEHITAARQLEEVEAALDDNPALLETWDNLMASVRDMSECIRVLDIRLARNLKGGEIPPEYDGTPEIRYVNHVECVSVVSGGPEPTGIEDRRGTVGFSNDDDLHFGVMVPQRDLGEWAVGARFQVVMLEAPYEG